MCPSTSALRPVGPEDDPSVPGLACDEVRIALDAFDRAFRLPMDAFRRTLGVLATGGGGSDPASGESARTMTYLCELARELPQQFREYVVAAQGGRPPGVEPIRLSAVLAEVDRRVAPEAAAKSQDFRCTVEGIDAEVRADLALCVEVLSRLARNAVLYGPPGSTVRVTAASLGSAWRMSVRDDGPGVPAKLRERVFEPFARLPRDIQDEVPGAGLGLAICHALVDRMGGIITLDGPPEGGTLATVELPTR